MRWEVRSVLECFYEEGIKWGTHRTTSKHMGVVTRCLADMGLEFWQHFTPSHFAYTCNSAFYDHKGVDKTHMREDYSCTTRGLIVWLAVWAQSRHYMNEKEKARAMLEALFGTAICDGYFLYDKLVADYDREFDECIMRNSQRQPCDHVRYDLRHIGSTESTFTWRSFVDMFVGLAFETDCLALDLLWVRLVYKTSVLVDQDLDRRNTSILRKDYTPMMTVNGKRRRVDEDFKLGVMDMTIQSGLRTGQMVVLTDMGVPSLARDCEQLSVKSKQVAAQESLTCAGVVCVADDSSGHGKPSESTNVSLIWDAKQNLCAVGQPMVKLNIFKSSNK